MAQRDIPGFYFDLEKNRYFPLNGPIPGSKRARPIASTHFQSGERLVSSMRNQTHIVKRKALIKSSKLLLSREMNGGPLIFKKDLHSFQLEYQKLLASHPQVWTYHNTPYATDSALEDLHGVVQTTKGLKETNLLAAGCNFMCYMRLYLIKNVRRHHDHGPNLIAAPAWPSMGDFHDGAPEIFSSYSVSAHLPSSISCIRRIEQNPSTTDNISSSQRALVTTFGLGATHGSVYVLNLNKPLFYNENSSKLNRMMKKVSSHDCTIWTAAASCHGTNAAIGTNYGASLINLETGKSMQLYHSRSDVFSQQFDLSGNILFCGIRNGAILAIDVRQKQAKCLEVSSRPIASSIRNQYKKPLRNSNFSNAVFMSSAVCSVVALKSDEQYFFGSSMDGSIKLFDLRFLNRDVQSYEGHVNSHSHLQLGINPSETFLLSGGEDSSVRIWSIKSGELIFEKNVSNCVFSTVCWPYYGDFSYGYDENLKGGKNPHQSCSWGVWLGSRNGLHYMRGA